MIPLRHAPVTVLKVHGDYTTLGLRNSLEELRDYPDAWNTLLDRVFDEWGVVVVGWSGEYDTALHRALQRTRPRYPMYWASYEGHVAEPARRLIALRDATLINTAGADEFFSDLKQRIDRLDQVARRRAKPQLLRIAMMAPDQSSAPQGWKALPLLSLRVVTAVAPVTMDTVGVIAPEHRESLSGRCAARASTKP